MTITDQTISGKKEYQFSQFVRLLDVFLIAPVLIYAGITGKVTRTLAIILIVIAMSTIIYNAYYFIKYSNDSNRNK